LNRPLAQQAVSQRLRRRTVALRVAMIVAPLLVLGGLASRLDLRPSLARLDVAISSGSTEGNYYRLVDSLTGLAARERGTVRNVVSEGSADNVRKLAEARQGCAVQVGLAQDGTAFGEPRPLLIGRLPKAESVFLFGRDADRIKEFAQLAKLKIGIGPAGSGAAHIAHTLFDLPELASLQVELSTHPLAEQLDLAATGALDLAMVVMDEDAELVKQAITTRGLQMVGFDHADVIARRIAHLRTGRIGAGEYDPVKLLPAVDKRVLRVETLVLGNGCSGRTQVTDLLVLLTRQFPDFLRHNRDTPNATGLELTTTSKEFFEHGGPELADQYAPWLVDIMPPANWAYVVMAVSLLFNAMGFGHRFRLWRIDAARVALESELTRLFGGAVTVDDLATRAPTGPGHEPLASIDALITALEQLSARSRRYSLSLLVPMGQEMAYRYQEELIHQLIAALRAARARLPGS
jgi:hypothetical protein